MAIAGQIISRIESDTLDVGVLWLSTPSCPRVGEISPREWKRAAYWKNDRRNEYIAAVASAFASMNTLKLRKYGVSVPFTPVIIDKPRKPLVVVLVENVEHGEEIVQRLPGWQLLHAQSHEPRPRVRKDAAAYVVTVSFASKYGLAADALI